MSSTEGVSGSMTFDEFVGKYCPTPLTEDAGTVIGLFLGLFVVGVVIATVAISALQHERESGDKE